MSMFQTLAYLSPLILGFGIAAALALTADRPPKRRLLAAGGVLAGLLAALLLSSLASTPKPWLPVSIVLASLGLLTSGVYLFCESARAPRELSQIAAGLVVCFLMSTLFWAGPLIRAAADHRADGASISRRISLSMDVNPFFVMAYSIFDVDLLHLPLFYNMGMADYVSSPPRWGVSSAGFAVAGAVLLALAAGLRRVLKP
jgi:hypothetical protein